MKSLKRKGALAKLGYLVLTVGLTMGMCASAFGATTNTVPAKPLILIGNSGDVSTISIKESGTGALSGTITLQCPAGVSFKTTTPSAKTTSIDLGGGVGVAADATLSDTTGDSKDDKAVWTIKTSSTAADTVVITGVTLELGSTVAAGDVALSVTSEFPGNPGLTEGDLVVAEAVAADAVAQLVTAPVNVAIGGAATSLSNIKFVEATAAALAVDDVITIQLPAGVTFDSAPTAAIDAGDVALDALPGTLNSPDNNKVTWTVKTKSGTASTVLISGIDVLAAASVSAGDINATVSAGTALAATSLKVAAAASKGIKSTVVASATTGWDKTTAALTAAKLPNAPADRVNITLASVLVVENFAEDLTIDDELVLTLPAGITYAAQPAVDYSDLAAKTTPSDPTGYDAFTITINNTISSPAAVGGLLIGNVTGLKVNIDATVAAGDIVATLSGTVGKKAITPISVTIGAVVATSVDVAANATIPAVGIGASGAIGEFTIEEAGAQALLANASSIIVTLPAGVTWAASKAPTATISTGDVVLTSAALSSTDSVATFKVNTASKTASTITVKGNIAIASTVALGDVTATISGTAGVVGTVVLATAADAVTVSSSAIPTLTAGVPTQEISSLTLTEAFAGALTHTGNFRLLASAGSWATATPTVAVTPAAAVTITGWVFTVGDTYATGDTLLVTANGGAARSVAGTITLSGLKLNVPATAATGDVVITLVNGDMAGANGAGLKGASLTMGYIGTPVDLTVAPAVATVSAGKTSVVTIAGGLTTYTVATSDDTVATATISGTTLTITGVAAGTATITVSDSAKVADTATVAVTVETATVVGDAAGVVAVDAAASDLLDLTLNITNAAGVTPAQEWLVFGGTVGGTDIGLFLFGLDASGVMSLVPFSLTLDPATITYAFDPTADAVSVIDIALGSLGFTAGDSFWYGYVYSPAAITSFDPATAVLGTDYLLENFVNITIK
jgi:hypothetical protein